MSTTQDTARIAALEPPYEPEIGEALRRMMGWSDVEAPAEVEPLGLFRTIARHRALLERFRQTGSTLLSFGKLEAGDRETVIHRVCARCGAEYEWGVHAVAFAGPLGLGAEWLAATVDGDAHDAAFSERQRLLVALADELHDSATVSDGLWERLAAVWSDDQLLELLALAGFYHLVAFVCNGARVALEPWAARFAEKGDARSEDVREARFNGA